MSVKKSTNTTMKSEVNKSSNSFEEVKIGNQIWMTTNLDVTHFRNGDAIAEAKTNKDWKEASKKQQPAWCHYDNSDEYGSKYGKLYNWYALIDARGLAPENWEIPSVEEWNELEKFLSKDNGLKIKSEQGWMDEGNGNNESGFNALPGGQRGDDGMFFGEEMGAYFWTKDESSNKLVHNRYILDTDNLLMSHALGKGYGLSVRCIKIKK